MLKKLEEKTTSFMNPKKSERGRMTKDGVGQAGINQIMQAIYNQKFKQKITEAIIIKQHII